MKNAIYRIVDEDYLASDPGRARRRAQVVAFIIGMLAIGLALGVHVIDAMFGAVCHRDSISHYFYEPRAGTFFVMGLTIVAAFLFTYRGERPLDSKVATLGAVAAACVAFFPTAGPGCNSDASNVQIVDLRPAMVVQAPVKSDFPEPQSSFDLVPEVGLPDGLIRAEFASETASKTHKWAAKVVFAVLLYFSAWAFVRQNAEADRGKDGKFTREKLARNTIYIIGSLAMVAGALLIVAPLPFDIARPVFWGEAIFLAAFGVTWLVKSRFLWGSLNLSFWGN